jgi:hypothetical protein
MTIHTPFESSPQIDTNHAFFLIFEEVVCKIPLKTPLK